MALALLHSWSRSSRPSFDPIHGPTEERKHIMKRAAFSLAAVLALATAGPLAAQTSGTTNTNTNTTNGVNNSGTTNSNSGSYGTTGTTNTSGTTNSGTNGN